MVLEEKVKSAPGVSTRLSRAEYRTGADCQGRRAPDRQDLVLCGDRQGAGKQDGEEYRFFHLLEVL